MRPDQYTGPERDLQLTTSPVEHILTLGGQKLPHGIYPLAIFTKTTRATRNIMTYLQGFGAKIFNDKGYFDFQTPPANQALACLQEASGAKAGFPTRKT